MEALDLRKQRPRSGYVELDGLLVMARTIDKLRAQLPGGHPGVYYINGQIKGISGYLLERLGVDEADLLKAVASAKDEAEVAAWLREHTDASQYPTINETLRRIKPKHSQDEAVFRAIYAETLAEHPEIEHIMDIVDADDERIWATAEGDARRESADRPS